jgi:hypothetical protein
VKADRVVRYASVGIASIAVALAGLVSSSVVSLSLWVALRFASDTPVVAVLAASVGVVAWISLLFAVGAASSRGLLPRMSELEGNVLAGAFLVPLVLGILARKYLQFLHPDLLPPPGAYVGIVPPTVLVLGILWFSFGRRLVSSSDNRRVGS